MDNSAVKGIKNENDFCGIGFIIIPDGVDPEIYKKDCYRNGRISIFGGYGHSNFYDIHIDSEVLQEIEFPKIGDKYGTPVVWINIPKHNQPIIVASITYDQNISNASEFARKFTKIFKQNIVNFEMDAKEGKMSLSVNSNTKRAQFEIFVNSKNNDSEMIIKVEGETIIHTSGRTIVLSEKSVEQVITNKRGIVIARTILNSEGEQRFIYEDEFKNEIIASKDNITITKNKNATITILANGDIQVSTDSNVDIQAGDKNISLDDAGVNINAGDGSVFVNGSHEVLYSKVSGLSEIADVSQIGISKTVKVG